ncbi:hypothetical protein [uncultured Tateyamaria sp.]|uniref:hypothetical protein n=1 Tax=uncultured Tateyamaria sp. TaxID=455651 RepID=UPI002613B40A|nr:hypothetical protein [uncultured Tateyamaria sp.]
MDQRTRQKIKIAASSPARSAKMPMNNSQQALCSHLLRYIALKMCANYNEFEYSMEKEVWDAKGIDRSFDYTQQLRANKGAVLKTDGITAWEMARNCLLKWNVIQVLSLPYYEMRIAASELDQHVRTHQNLTLELFAWALETFFDCDYQEGWDDKTGKSYIQVSRELVTLFKANELVEQRSGKLIWSQRISPYFSCKLGGWPDKSDHCDTESGIEEAQEFFDRICSN